MHRVGLTRHCLASGRIQLPFALSDAFPEGDLLAHDVDHDELVLLESLPPRRLSGLREYFERNELQVNDVLEFRLAAGELRLASVRRARRAPEEEREAPPAASTPDARPAAAPSGAGDAAGAGRDRVIGRIGSVTVRRLGSGRFAPPPEAALRSTGHDAPADREPDARVAGDAPVPAGPDAGPAGTEDEAAGPRAAVDAGPADASRAAAAPADASRGDAPRDDLPRAEVVDDLDALLDTPPVPGAEAQRERVGEADLLDEGELRGRDRGGREAPVLRWLRRPGAAVEAEPQRPRRPEPRRPESHRADPSRSAPRRPDPHRTDPKRPGPARASRAAEEPRVADRGAETVVPADRPTSDAPAAPGRPGGGPAGGAGDPGERQRAREEALSRAGDLRSRMVRWLLDPRTPVIIQHEHVQERFGLEASVARDVLAGILDDPPPSLRLTAVREDVLRVSRVTVQHEG